MSNHQKKIYFKRKAKEYERRINKHNDENMKNGINRSKGFKNENKKKKSVSFCSEYDVKIFAKNQEAACVGDLPVEKDYYKFEHYRC